MEENQKNISKETMLLNILEESYIRKIRILEREKAILFIDLQEAKKEIEELKKEGEK
jgi:hypothetical protein